MLKMVRQKMYIVLVLMIKIIFTEARVFCQDSNAAPWKPLGLACPITCSTIVTAVDRLKVRDYHYLMKERETYRVNMTAGEIFILGRKLKNNIVYGRKSNYLHPNMKKHIKLYHTYHRLLSNKHFKEALKIEAGKMTVELNKTCSNMAAKDLYKKKIVNVKCTRKLNKRSDILTKFTKFLNMFADPMYPFDEDMSGVILQKLEGNLNLRYGVVDYKRILTYLAKALKYHRTHSKDQFIRLQVYNCVNIYQPGCFCRIGFVENQGQCVNPEDCISNPMFTEYLERIILY